MLAAGSARAGFCPRFRSGFGFLVFCFRHRLGGMNFLFHCTRSAADVAPVSRPAVVRASTPAHAHNGLRSHTVIALFAGLGPRGGFGHGFSLGRRPRNAHAEQHKPKALFQQIENAHGSTSLSLLSGISEPMAARISDWPQAEQRPPALPAARRARWQAPPEATAYWRWPEAALTCQTCVSVSVVLEGRHAGEPDAVRHLPPGLARRVVAYAHHVAVLVLLPQRRGAGIHMRAKARGLAIKSVAGGALVAVNLRSGREVGPRRPEWAGFPASRGQCAR